MIIIKPEDVRCITGADNSDRSPEKDDPLIAVSSELKGLISFNSPFHHSAD